MEACAAFLAFYIFMMWACWSAVYAMDHLEDRPRDDLVAGITALFWPIALTAWSAAAFGWVVARLIDPTIDRRS